MAVKRPGNGLPEFSVNRLAYYDAQISQSSCGHNALYDSLESFIPHLSTRLRLSAPDNRRVENQLSVVDYFSQKREAQNFLQSNPLSVSADGETFSGLGCFQLGLEVSLRNFEDLVQIQRSLKDLDL